MRMLFVAAVLCSIPVMADNSTVVRVDMEDGLRFPSGFVAPSPSGPVVIFIKGAPASWLAKGTLTPAAKATVLAKLYGGPNWEKGNEDGSTFVVKSFSSRVLSAKDLKGAELSSTKGTWFYEVSKTGALEKRGPQFAAVAPD